MKGLQALTDAEYVECLHYLWYTAPTYANIRPSLFVSIIFLSPSSQPSLSFHFKSNKVFYQSLSGCVDQSPCL